MPSCGSSVGVLELCSPSLSDLGANGCPWGSKWHGLHCLPPFPLKFIFYIFIFIYIYLRSTKIDIKYFYRWYYSVLMNRDLNFNIIGFISVLV